MKNFCITVDVHMENWKVSLNSCIHSPAALQMHISDTNSSNNTDTGRVLPTLLKLRAFPQLQDQVYCMINKKWNSLK